MSIKVSGGGGSSGGSLELTDGTHDLVKVTKATATDLLVGGTSAAATLKPSLTTHHAELTANVTGGVSWVLVDILSLALEGGTWLVAYELSCLDNTGGGRSLAVLEDPGAAHYAASTQQPAGGTSGTWTSQSGVAIITIASPGTVKLRQANGSLTGCTVEGNSTVGGTTYSLTNMTATRIG